jgi:hypothetical protein
MSVMVSETAMDTFPRFRGLVAQRAPNMSQNANEFDQLQALYPAPIPEVLREFLVTLSDCILYYRFEAVSKTGKPKKYSHFVLTNIGPDIDWGRPMFPSSLMDRIQRYRQQGLPNDVLPLMFDFGKTLWLWCRITDPDLPILVPKGTREFGSQDKEWTVLSPRFDDFIAALQVDLAPFKSVLKQIPMNQSQPTLIEWLQAAIGDDWESQATDMLSR